jgi:hypothetical protein
MFFTSNFFWIKTIVFFYMLYLIFANILNFLIEAILNLGFSLLMFKDIISTYYKCY